MRVRNLTVGLLFILGVATAAAQETEIQPVDFLLGGRIDLSGGSPIEHARVIVTRTDDSTVLVDRTFTDASGNYATVFQAEVEVELGLDDPPGNGFEPGPRSAANWMGAAWPNPIHASGDVHLTLPYSAPEGAKERPQLDLFDTRGRRIAPRETLASGVYYYRLRFGMRLAPARKLMVLGRGQVHFDLQELDGSSEGAGPEAAKRGDGIVEVEVLVQKPGFVDQLRILTLDSTIENDASFSLVAEAPPTSVAAIGGTLQAGEAVLFDGSASSGNGALTYAWDFGDGQRGGGAHVAHVYAKPGQYTVELTVAGPYGSAASSTAPVDILAGPPPISSAAMVVGSITDAVGNLLEGVTVTYLETNESQLSLPDGSVTFTGMPTGVPIILELTKPGFSKQTVRLSLPANNEFSNFEASLRRRRAPIAFASIEDGGLAESEDGACVLLPPEALELPDGSPAAGSATVCVTPVDVSDPVEAAAFPSGYDALRPTGEAGLLLSYGVMEVVFEQGGQELQLSPGVAAEIEIPMYASDASIGESIDLWSVDPSTGLWRQEGSGIVVESEGSPTGLALRAEVTHFSWWNCDDFDRDPPERRPRCKLRDVDGFPVIDIPEGESCYIDVEIDDDDGPWGRPNNNIPPEGRDLPFPNGVSGTINGSASNGTLRGSVAFSTVGSPKAEQIIIPLDPIAAGGGHLAPPVSMEASLDPVGDVDFYTFDASMGQYISLFVRSAPASFLSGTLTLRDPNSNSILSEPFSTQNTAAVLKIPMSGQYTIEIDGEQNEPGAYAVDLHFIESFDIGIPSRVQTSLSPGLVTKFEFDAPADTWFSMNYRKIGGGPASAYLMIEDPSGVLIYNGYMGGLAYSTLPLKFDVAGLYCINVLSLALDGEYELAVRDIPEILPGSIVESEGKPGMTHYYRFQATAGEMVKASIDPMNGFNGDATIVDEEGDVPTAALPPIAWGNSSSLYELQESGVHFLFVWSNASSVVSPAVPYRASVNLVPHPVPLSFDAHGRATRHPNIARFGDIRVFSFEGNEGDGVNIQMLKDAASTLGTSAVFRIWRVGAATPRDPQFSVNDHGSVGRFHGDDAIGVHEASFLRLPATDTYILLFAAETPEEGPFELIVDKLAASSFITVDDDLVENPSADTRSLQAALMATTAEGTVQLAAGDYFAPASFYPHDVISVEGAGMGQTTLRSRTFSTVLKASSSGYRAVRDLTIKADFGQTQRTVDIGGGDGMTFERVATAIGAGMLPLSVAMDLESQVGLTVRDCVFADTQRALYLKWCQDSVVENNTVTNYQGLFNVDQCTNLEILNNQWTQDYEGTAINIVSSVGTIIADNEIIIDTADSGGGSLQFAIDLQDRDDAGTGLPSIIRGNRIVTNEAGISVETFRDGSSAIVEGNFVDVTSDSPRMGLSTDSRGSYLNMSLLVRNNVFKGVTSFGGIYMRGVDTFDSIELINNTLEVALDQVSNIVWAVGLAADLHGQTGPLPVRIANNIFRGIGGEGISIPTDRTVDSDYNLFYGFDSNYADGMSSTGTNDLNGNPDFIDAELRVSGTSPAVDSGATTAEVPTVPVTDIDGNSRPAGSGVDRGAHER